MAEIKVLKARDGNLYHNHHNQLTRAIGRYTLVYIGERSGTVRDLNGKYWDWWETPEMLDATFYAIQIVPAR